MHGSIHIYKYKAVGNSVVGSSHHSRKAIRRKGGDAEAKETTTSRH